MCKKLVLIVSCIVVLAMTASTVLADITEGLVGHWLLTDGTGNVALDSSGAGNDGTIDGNPTWVSDPERGGTVMVFDGVDDRINFGPLYTLQNNSWSFSLWFKTPPSDDRIPLVGKNDASGGFNTGEFDIEITGNGTWGNIITPEPAGNLAVNAHSQGGAVTNQDVISLDDDTWHLGTVVHDDSAGATDITFYIDGVVQVTGSQTFNNNGQADVGDVYLGFANASGSGAEGYFTGRMSDLRLYDRALTPEEVVQIFEASLTQEAAGNASPADEAVDVLRHVTLSWSAGKFAQTHNVYFGTTFADVDDADIDAAVSQNQTATSYDAGVLDFGQTYYWRVDEVNGAPDRTVFKGDVWSFTVEPYSIPVETVVATASTAHAADMGPENTVGGVGLNELDQHSTEPTEMWLSGMGDPTPSIQYEFDKAYKLHEMWVWNSNQVIESFVGIGAKDVVIETSVDGVEWIALAGPIQLAQAPGQATYTANTTIDFGNAMAKYVRITVQSGYGLLPQFGLSEVRFFYIPTFAREPMPAEQAVTEGVDVTLTWRVGREAASHEVYLGTAPQDLPLIATTTDSSYAATQLDYDQTYYWQVVEVNEAEDPATYTSPTWRFNTPPYGTVEDFEQYDDDCNRIFFAWKDGLGHNGGEDVDDCDEPPFNGNGGGSIVGHASSPFAEKSIVHSGTQSMPLEYDNAFGVSETSLPLTGQDWTANGVQTLSLMFYGAPGNTGQLYLKINNSKVVYDGEATSLGFAQWKAWNIDLSTVGGGLTNVTSLTIGVDGASASGMLYLDSIRLYPQAGTLITPADPGTTNLVGAWSFDEGGGTVATDSSGNGRNGTIVGALWDTGKQGSALSFDGASAYVNIDGFKGVNTVGGVQQAFTVSNWIKTEYAEGEMVTWGTNTGGQRLTWRINASTLRTEHGSGNLRGNTPVDNGEWHHVALVANEGAALRVPQTVIYLNGLPDSTFSGSDNPYNLTADVDVRIGMGGPTGGRYFTGLIDEVKIFSAALAPEEILWLAGRTTPMHAPFD